MTKTSAARPTEEEQEQEISIKEFMKIQKQLMGNMQLMFQKHATATPTTLSSGSCRSRAVVKDSNNAS